MEKSLKVILLSILALASTSLFLYNNTENTSYLRQATEPAQVQEVSEWEQFKIDFQVKFESEEEESYKKSVFEDNLKFIKEFNATHDNVKLGVNKFAIMSNDEFKQRFLNKEEHSRKLSSTEFDLTEDYHTSEKELQKAAQRAPLPSNWNWLNYGAVTAPLNQGSCGSSWALSAKDGLESLWQISTGDLVELSAQQILDCEPHGRGCLGGNPGNAWLYTKSDGISTEANYKYTPGKAGECTFNGNYAFKNEQSMRVRIQSPLSAMKYVLNQPLSVGVDASTQAFQFYKDGVFGGVDCGQDINLAVTLLGYNDVANKPYWIIKNNWGSSWGEGGFAKLEKSLSTEPTLGTCGILTDPTFPKGVKTE